MFHLKFNKRINKIQFWKEWDYEFEMWEIQTIGL